VKWSLPVFKKNLLVAITVLWPAIATGLLPLSEAKASVLLDQSYLVSDGTIFTSSAQTDPTFRRVQTFIVGLTGTLTEIDVAVTNAPTGPFTLNLLATVLGTPTNVIVTSPTVNLTAVGGFMDFFFSQPVFTGEVLGFELVAPSHSTALVISGKTVGTYAEGSDFFINTASHPPVNNFTSSGGDENFRTFVDTGVTAAVPEPSTWAMLLLGFAGIGFAGYRRSKLHLAKT
jgi:hypothetical protein